MNSTNEVVFRLVVNHEAVEKALEELENKAETKFIRDAEILTLQALLCSDVIYVPMSQLSMYIKYGKTL